MNEWDEWKQKADARRHAEARAKIPPPKPRKDDVPHRPLTEDELLMLKGLQKVRTGGTAGWQAKRFIEDYTDATLEILITERQAWYLKVLWYRYRRQLGVSPSKPEGLE